MDVLAYVYIIDKHEFALKLACTASIQYNAIINRNSRCGYTYIYIYIYELVSEPNLLIFYYREIIHNFY